MKKEEQDCIKSAEILNRIKSEENVSYVVCPTNIGDLVKFQMIYEENINNAESKKPLPRDRNGNYCVYKIKINSNGIRTQINWIGKVA